GKMPGQICGSGKRATKRNQLSPENLQKIYQFCKKV
ncbi:unnamed protein product, partial [marine sediment metagenome]